MKKSLVALAAMSVIGAVSAQSTVTLYGLADAYIASERIGTARTATTPGVNGVTQTRISSGGLNGSRWGLRVSEDLGGGLAAIAQVESGFDISTGTQQQNALFGRQAFVGLKSGFGTVSLGRQYSSYDNLKVGMSLQAHSAFDATNGGYAANTYKPSIGAWRGYNPRVDNSVKFQSNNFSGLSFSAIYGMGENKRSDASASNTFGMNAMYANGPIAVGLGYQNEGFARGVAVGSPAVQVGNGKNELENTLLVGAYDFGVAKLVGGYNEARTRVNGSSTPKAKEWFLGMSAPLGATTFKIQYAASKLSSLNNDSIAFEALYDLSKRTTAYVGYNIANFDKAGPTGGDMKDRRAGVGIRHRF